MAVDFSSYLPPGTYVDEKQSTLATVSGLPPTLVAIVGPSAGAQTASEQVSLASVAAVLTNRGIDQTQVTVTTASGQVLAVSEYTLTTTGDIPSRNYYTNIALAAAAVTPAGTQVVVSYKFIDPNFYAPKTFIDFNDVKAAYGEPLNLVPPVAGATSYTAITSPLSLAAKLAFDNGAAQVLLVATTPAPVAATTATAISASNRSAISDAYAKIEQNYSAGVLCPLTDGIITADAPGVGTDLKNHLDLATKDGFPRIGMLGFEAAVTTIPTVLLNSGGFRFKRLVLNYCVPGGMAYYSGAINRYLALGHQYLAVAAGGRLSASPPQQGLTAQPLNSFSGFSGAPLANRDKDAYAAAGVCITEVDRNSQVVVRHGLTTDVTSINTREISVIRGRDAMISLILNGLHQAKLIGSPVTVNTPISIKSVVSGFLEYSVSQGVILSYKNLLVRQQSIDPSVIEVVFSYAPIYPLNYIAISFGIDLTAGTITPTATAA